MITTQKELRKLFWQTFPDLPRKKIRNYSDNGTMYRTDTRVTWCNWIDALSKSNEISQELAQRVTLDG
jgi:hypothetical protein